MLLLRAAHLPREPSTRPAHRVRPAPTPLRGGAVRCCNAYGPMAANESSGPSFYASTQESAATQIAVHREFALRHALFQLVAACSVIAWQCCLLGVRDRYAMPRFSRRRGGFSESIRMPYHFRYATSATHGTHAARTARHACTSTDYFEMVSSAMPFVRGPMSPIAAITITIAPAMNANTPKVPKPFSTAAITNDEKIAEKRLHE
ncbi:hypothetical protein LMG29660_06277 [Burkholderia puraquae]|uniref:Uncharacterized protein n=1 Tax=Burkholderia puraquae TaxID=1904757 RepID=A0A6J5ERH2_9BURK|nr:hypothetical protein LMG29660_06277 [Burkholderia puraquae]